MYSDHVQAQKQRNPCLSDLHEFLQQPVSVRDQSRIVCLDVFEHSKSPIAREIPVKDLRRDLQSLAPQRDPSEPERKGRILLIEDASKYTIEALGTFYNIDPWFFASYVHQTWRKTSTQDPTRCSLPSRDKKQSFLPLQYHRTAVFQHKATQLRSLTRDCNHRRKVVLLPIIGGMRIGLIQHCCSVLLVDCPGREWTGIILADSPISNNYISPKGLDLLPSYLDSVPFLGGCEDFLSISQTALFAIENQPTVSNRGMLDELIYYWSQQCPPMFDPSSPTLESLSYYPLKIVAAEWVNYISVMGISLRQYEFSTALSGDLFTELEKLSLALRILQGWRRRVLSTQTKLQRTIRFIKDRSDWSNRHTGWDDLVDDYDFIHVEVTKHGKGLEALVPLATSTVALIESRRSLTEAANVTRLTVLAVVFLPPSFVATLFGMSDEFRPGGSLFWVYFVAAIPMAIIVGLLVKPPVGAATIVLGKMSGLLRLLY